jgi:hypothetical protein
MSSQQGRVLTLTIVVAEKKNDWNGMLHTHMKTLLSASGLEILRDSAALRHHPHQQQVNTSCIGAIRENTFICKWKQSNTRTRMIAGIRRIQCP